LKKALFPSQASNGTSFSMAATGSEGTHVSGGLRVAERRHRPGRNRRT
jgi:hypothetical protein